MILNIPNSLVVIINVNHKQLYLKAIQIIGDSDDLSSNNWSPNVHLHRFIFKIFLIFYINF